MRLHLPLSVLLPRYIRRNLIFLAVGPIVVLGIFAYVAWTQVWALETVAILTPFAILASLVLTLAAWPFRFARGGGYRMREDGTLDSNYYRLRFSEANHTVSARVRDGRLDVGGGLFSPHHLNSLAIEKLEDGLLGLVGLSFAGSAVSHQMLIGWPGVSEDTAIAIRAAVLERVNAVPRSVAGDANKGINLTARR